MAKNKILKALEEEITAAEIEAKAASTRLADLKAQLAKFSTLIKRNPKKKATPAATPPVGG